MQYKQSKVNNTRSEKRPYRTSTSDRKIVGPERSLEESKVIGILKAYLFRVFIRDAKWKLYRPQYSLELSDSVASLITEMLEIRKKQLLNTVYDLVVKHNAPHELVYQALLELLPQLRMEHQLGYCMQNSLAMMIYAMYEHSTNGDLSICAELLVSKMKNGLRHLNPIKHEYPGLGMYVRDVSFTKRFAVDISPMQASDFDSSECG